MAFDAQLPTTSDAIRAAFTAANMAAPDPAFVREIARWVTPEYDLADVARCADGEAACYFNTSPWGDFARDLKLALSGYVRQPAQPVLPLPNIAFSAMFAASAAREVRA